MTSLSVDRRFLLLTVLGYGVALVAVLCVVWITARPVLESMTNRALDEQATAAANAVEALLVEHKIEVDYLARNDELANFLLGHSVSALSLQDAVLNDPHTGAPYAQIRLFDYAGREIFAFDRDGRTFSAADFTSAAHDLFATPGMEVHYRMRPGSENRAYNFLIAVPVTILDRTEGVLAISIAIAPEQIAKATSHAGTQLVTEFELTQQARWYPGSAPGLSARVANSSFHVSLPADPEMVAQQGRALVRRVLGAACLALIVPFSVMALVGHRAIVEPTRALAESRRILEAQRADLQGFGLVAKMSSDGYVINDQASHIIWVNDAIEAMSGYTREECIGKRPIDLIIHPEDRDGLGQRIFNERNSGRPVRTEARCLRKNGEEFWIDLRISPLIEDDGTCERFCAVWTDITERKETEAKLREARRKTEFQAMHDTLTGLPNRRFLDTLMASEFGADDPPRTLVRVDLDHFKNVNDTMGHAAGDHVLKEVSRILSDGVRSGDIVSRVGGDEFVIVCAPGCNTEMAAGLCDRLLRAIRKPISFDTKTCHVGASFGIASAEDRLVTNPELLVSADAALYLAKEQGRNTVTLYTPEVHRGVQGHRKLATEIEQAIARDEFEPFFQPQFSAHDMSLAGIEALARWRHPTEGILPPAAFLPIAGKLSLVPEIDQIIFDRALDSVRQLGKRGIYIPKVSFNVGAHQLEDTQLHEVVSYADMGETVISFEVLESVLVEEQTNSFSFNIDRLRDAGVSIEVDDFGSGHASIIGLRKLAPDVMKIDQRLVLPLTESLQARDIMQALIGIGRTLGISVTAEGVETAEHARILRDLGCDTLQGYHFARPLARDDLAEMLGNTEKLKALAV